MKSVLFLTLTSSLQCSVSVCTALDDLFWETGVLYQKQAREDEKEQEADKKT